MTEALAPRNDPAAPRSGRGAHAPLRTFAEISANAGSLLLHTDGRGVFVRSPPNPIWSAATGDMHREAVISLLLRRSPGPKTDGRRGIAPIGPARSTRPARSTALTPWRSASRASASPVFGPDARAGESGRDAAAEGATAPESLRQKGPRAQRHSGKSPPSPTGLGGPPKG
jgi:hypothetical protein